MAANASRTTGVAPLYVHFDADVAASTPTVRPFHWREFSWNFGDGTAWWGLTSKSKKTAKGPLAAHVYETAGTFTAQLVTRENGTIVGVDTFEITVTDPDTVYTGTLTTCVSDTEDFTGAPAGSTHVTTSNLSTITSYTAAGHRLLFRRGGVWTTGALAFASNHGPVTIGAFGTGATPDELGIYANAPAITCTADFMSKDHKWDWRLMDIKLIADGSDALATVSGDSSVDTIQFLMLRLEATGFYNAGWSHYKINADDPVMDQMAMVECHIHEGLDYCVYIGGERLAIMGNHIHNANGSAGGQNGHLCRVWQAYKTVCSENSIHSPSMAAPTYGGGVLRFNAPAESDIDPNGTGAALANGSQFVVVSDNILGTTKTYTLWLIATTGTADERLTDFIVERNKFLSDYGDVPGISGASVLQKMPIIVAGRYITIRNNVMSAPADTAIQDVWIGIDIAQFGVMPDPIGVECYNNTMYDSEIITSAWAQRTGFFVGATCTLTVIRNNLVTFLNGADTKTLISDASVDLVQSNNLLATSPGYVDPTNADPLLRNYAVAVGSAAIDEGVAVPVYEDFTGKGRPVDDYDIGAYEYGVFGGDLKVMVLR